LTRQLSLASRFPLLATIISLFLRANCLTYPNESFYEWLLVIFLASATPSGGISGTGSRQLL
jgi:hypothetical protein